MFHIDWAISSGDSKKDIQQLQERVKVVEAKLLQLRSLHTKVTSDADAGRPVSLSSLSLQGVDAVGGEVISKKN
jgi:hypothetical protein